MSMFVSQHKQRGMTLLEVMLALFILATAGLAVMNAASGTLNNQAQLKTKTFAFWVASNYLTELKLEETWPSTGWSYDTEEFAGLKWYVRYKGIKTSTDDFRGVDVEVSETKEGRALAYMRTYIAKP